MELQTKKTMKYIRLIICFLSVFTCCKLVNAQGYNSDRIALSNFLIRMYEQNSFEGVKIVDDYYHQFLISVVSLNKDDYEDQHAMDRVSEIMSRSQASKFFNGSKITEYDIIKMSDNFDDKKCRKAIKTVNEKSFGFVKALELLSKNEIEGRTVYFYSTLIK